MGNKLDLRLWGEACLTAAYLDNRTAKQSLNGITPYEKLRDVKPLMGHIKVFGCPAYTFIPKKLREGTFSPHKKLQVFVGYPDETKGWKFFDVETEKFYVAESVLFLEEEVEQEPETYNRIQEIEDHSAPFEGETDSSNASIDGENNIDNENYMVNNNDDEENQVVHVSNTIEELETPIDSRTVPTRIQPARERRPRDQWQGSLFMKLTKLDKTDVPNTYKEAMERNDADDWMAAFQSELDSLHENNTYSLVDLPKGRKAIGTRWVLSIKDAIGDLSEKRKARLVAQGFSQIEGIDYEQTYAPVARAVSIRCFFSIVGHRDLEVLQIDVVTAFLYGKLSEEIYVKQPPGFADHDRPNAVWRLHKALYGLKQASKVWYETLKDKFVELGFKVVQAEACIFRAENPEGTIWVIAYVDDMSIAAVSMTEILKLVQDLKATFKVKVIGELKKFLGFEISRDRQKRTVYLKQEAYAQTILERFEMADCRGAKTPMEHGLKVEPGLQEIDVKIYQKATGSLNYLYTMTRPDIGYALSTLAAFSNSPTEEHWNAMKRILRYIKQTKGLGLELGGKSLKLRGFMDASFADKWNSHSTGGYVFFLGNGAISWASKAQSLVALSSTESEYIQSTETAKEGLWLKKLLPAFDIEIGVINILGDNQSALKLAWNDEFHPRTKHIAVRYHFIREAIANNDISISWIPTDENAADIMTKALPLPRHTEMVKLLNLVHYTGPISKGSVED